MRYLCIWAYHEKLLTKHTLETTKMATKCFHGITRNKYKKSLWMLSLMWNKLMYTLGISGILMSVSSGLSWHAYIIHLSGKCNFCITNPIGHRRFFQYRIGVGILLEHQNKCIWTTTFLAEVIRCPKVATRRNKLWGILIFPWCNSFPFSKSIVLWSGHLSDKSTCELIKRNE